MKYPGWRALGGGVLCVLAVGLVWAGCRVGSDNRLLVERNGPESTFESELRRMEQLEKRRTIVHWGLTTRCTIADRVSAGRLTLFEAAAAFRAIDKVKERAGRVWPGEFPGETEEERLCHRVIHFVFARLCGSAKQDEVVDRLEGELKEHLRQHGTVQLPEFRPPEGIPWFDEQTVLSR
jgi:hypothetical protein